MNIILMSKHYTKDSRHDRNSIKGHIFIYVIPNRSSSKLLTMKHKKYTITWTPASLWVFWDRLV